MLSTHILLLLTCLIAVATPQQTYSYKTTFTFDGQALPSGLSVSNYQAGQHYFSPSNAAVTGGYLQLKVPGGQAIGNVSSGEVVTNVNNILYGSFRVYAILSQPAGIVNGMFFYKSDTQEIDIEWVSDPTSQSNPGVPRLWFTDQNVNGNGPSTNTNIAPPADATTAEHEYRFDWAPGLVAFYVDGKQEWNTTQNVPSTPGSFILNNWSDGDKGWSAGPPATDAIFKVRNLTMSYNTA